MKADSGSRRRLNGLTRPASGVKSGTLGGRLAHALALECQAVRVVYEPIEDGVGDGRIGDRLVPVIDRQLAGHDRRAAIVPIVDDLEEVAALLGGERGEAPIVEDQQLDARQALEEPRMTPVAACECQGIEQPWHAMIEDGAIVAACLVAERTGKPTFAGAGRAGRSAGPGAVRSSRRSTSLANSALSRPRAAFMSTSSTIGRSGAGLANFNR